MVAEYLKGARALVLPRIPTEWHAALTRNAHWTICHASQIERICAGEPARLDRNCQAILALDIAFKLAQNSVLRTINVFDFVALVPATYAIRNLSDYAKAWLKGQKESELARKRLDELITALCPAGRDAAELRPRAMKFLSNVACGYPLTHQNAEIIVSHMLPDWGSPQIILLHDRVQGGRRKATKNKREKPGLRCCDCEGAFIRLDPKKLARLAAVRTKRVRAQDGP